MKSSSKAIFPLGLLASAMTLMLSYGDGKHDHEHPGEVSSSPDSAQPFTIPSGARVDTEAVEFMEFRTNTETVTAVPKSAIIRENGKTYVYAQPDKDKAAIERWEVTLGYGNNDQYVEALTGVFPGDLVVTSGLDLIAPQSTATPFVEQTEDRFVFGDGNGAVVKVPSASGTPAKAPIEEPVPAPSYRQNENRFGYRTEKPREPRFEKRVYQDDPHVYAQDERYIIVPQYEILHRYEYDRVPCDIYGVEPSFIPSCELNGPGYFYGGQSGYCPNDGYGHWGH